MPGFITRSTLTANCSVACAIMRLPELEALKPAAAGRAIYVEPVWMRDQRSEPARRMPASGFSGLEDEVLLTPDGAGVVSDWRLLVS